MSNQTDRRLLISIGYYCISYSNLVFKDGYTFFNLYLLIQLNINGPLTFKKCVFAFFYSNIIKDNLTCHSNERWTECAAALHMQQLNVSL